MAALALVWPDITQAQSLQADLAGQPRHPRPDLAPLGNTAPGDPAQAQAYVPAPAHAPPAGGPSGEALPAQPAAPSSARPAYRRGLLCLPHVGLNQPVGDATGGHLPGFRAGSLVGYNLLSFFSLNAELDIDVLNVKTPHSTGYYASEVIIDFALSPLLHFGPPHWLVVIGPKLGVFRHHSAAGSEGGYWWGPDRAYNGSGLAYGINLGALIPLERTAVGAFFSYTGHHWSSRCENDFSTGYRDVCDTSGSSDIHVLGFAAALLF